MVSDAGSDTSISLMAVRAAKVAGAVPDPEIPVLTLADLGIFRGVTEDDGVVSVVLTPTYSGCPATQRIEADVRAALLAAAMPQVRVVTQLAPAWTTDWITDAGREKLRAYGIAPPAKGASKRALFDRPAVRCPRCGSDQTQEISHFGSTPCKALWRCQSCKEPFDAFKCL